MLVCLSQKNSSKWRQGNFKKSSHFLWSESADCKWNLALKEFYVVWNNRRQTPLSTISQHHQYWLSICTFVNILPCKHWLWKKICWQKRIGKLLIVEVDSFISCKKTCLVFEDLGQLYNQQEWTKIDQSFCTTCETGDAGSCQRSPTLKKWKQFSVGKFDLKPS